MKIVCSLLISLFLLSGCLQPKQKTSPPEGQTATPTAQTLKGTPTSTPTNTPSPTRVVSPTLAPTLQPTRVPTKINTPAPVASLTKDEAANIIDLLNEPSGCELPCWAGLTPGISTFSDIQGFAARLGDDFSEEQYDQENDWARFFVANSENFKENPNNIPGNPIWVDVYWENGLVHLIVIKPNEVTSFLHVDHIYNQLRDPDTIFLIQPYGNVMGFILDYRSRGFAYAINSVTTEQATICLDDSLDKSITLELYDPANPVDIVNQERLFFLPWTTQADPGYSIPEIMDRIVNKECLHYLDFAKEW